MILAVVTDTCVGKKQEDIRHTDGACCRRQGWETLSTDQGGKEEKNLRKERDGFVSHKID